jgi:magnesium and cobalt exporter, CNNM family
MSGVVLNCLLILLLVVIQGIFVAAELALVSLRESQVRQLAHRGKRGQLIAKLTSNPNLFLSVAQVGVTLSGFLAAAFGADKLSDDLAPALERLGLSSGAADTISLVLITIVISYVSIVIGELTAKRLALQRAESVALALSPLVDFTGRIARPVIWLLGVSTNVIVRILGGDPKVSREEVTNEEIRAMVRGSTTLGDEERRIVEDVFAAGERGLREVMVPRTEGDFLPGNRRANRVVREVIKAPHSRYPVIGDSADDVIGFVHVRDLLDPEVSSRTTPVAEVARPVVSMPDTVRVLRALSDMRRGASHLAIVLDEYGGTSGIVTMEDLVEELVGEITDEYDVVAEERVGVRGDLVIEGLTTLDDFAEKTGLVLPEGPYDTLAGFFMARLGQLPSVGDVISLELASTDPRDEELAQVELRVSELDGRRAAAFVVHRQDGKEFTPTSP